MDRMVIHFDEDRSGFQSGLRCHAAGADPRDDHAGLLLGGPLLGECWRQVSEFEAKAVHADGAAILLGRRSSGRTNRGELLRLFRNGDRDPFLVSVSEQHHFDGFPGWLRRYKALQVPCFLGWSSCQRGDNVTGLDACFGSGRSVNDLANDHAGLGRNAQARRHIRSERANLHAQITAMNTAVGEQLVHDGLGHVAGDCQPDALRAAALTFDRTRDPHDLSVETYQRSTAVARIDGGIGLQEVFVQTYVRVPAFAANDAPAVTEPRNPKGAPTARTRSPISMASLLPHSR